MNPPGLLLLLLAGISLQGFARQDAADSLIQAASEAGADSAKADLLLEAAVYLMERQPEKGIDISRQALVLAEKRRDIERMALSLQRIGVCYDYKDNLDSCLFYLDKANNLLMPLNKPALRSNIISDIAIAYYFRGNYELALRFHLQALELRKHAGELNAVSKSLNNIGLLYKNRKDIPNAIKYYRESIAIKEQLNDEKGLLNTYMNLGSMFHSDKQYDSALIYGNKTLVLAQQLNQEDDVAAALSNIAEALSSLDRYGEAETMLYKAREYAERSDCLHCMLTIYHGIGNIFENRQQYNKALENFNTGLAMVRGDNLVRQMKAFYEDLSECYRKMGQFRLALLHQDSAQAIATRMLNEENLRQINELTTVYETAQKEKQIEKLNADQLLSQTELKRRKRERNYFIVSSVLFLALSVIAWLAYTSNKKKNALLNSQKRIIEQSLQEKEILLKEIHHRVKNNLQIVSSLLSLQTDYIKDERALDVVKESRNRVHAMALIHHNLYQEDNLTGINVEDYISNLCDNLFNSYNIRPGQVQLVKDIQALQLDVEIVVPLGLMINELITNSLKYAFPDNRAGIIKIFIAQNEALQLSVYDNGIGLPDDFNQQETGSFGFRMIQAFVRKMKGELHIYTEDGTRVDIVLKQYKPVVYA